MKCEHKWVNYQPLLGEPYICCANANCGITEALYYKQELEEAKVRRDRTDSGQQLSLFEQNWGEYNNTPKSKLDQLDEDALSAWTLPKGYIK